jgi:D-tyrosyl-tRNA(Tyr) deacylase
MRALIQRVKHAEVRVGEECVGRIGPGILTLLGVGPGDTEAELQWMIAKILKLRIFEDSAGKMNLSVQDLKLAHLIVSQFTLYGDCSQGNRPGFAGAAPPALAEPLYRRALELSREAGVETAGGRFGAHMQVSLENDGPVTLWLESKGNP